MGLQARYTPANPGAPYSAYKLQIEQSFAVLFCFPGGSDPIALGRYTLPKRLQPGDTVLAELRVQGDRLTALLDGAVGIEARDSRLPGPGQWGIIASDGWFESVEVQTPLTAAAPVVSAFGPWQPLFTEAEWKEAKTGEREVVEGRVHLLHSYNVLKPAPSADGAIRARILCQQESQFLGFLARLTPEGGCYKAELNPAGTVVMLRYFLPGSTRGSNNQSLGEYILPRSLKPGDTHVFELRLQGDFLTVLVDGVVAIEARDSRAPGPGQWGITAVDGWFESVEVASAPPSAQGGRQGTTDKR